MKSDRRILLSLRLIGAVVLFFAGGAGGADSALQRSVRAIVADYLSAGKAHVGLHVVSLGRAATLCEFRADEPMIPASNQKIVTSAVALKRLGGDFEFRTQLALIGNDLVVTGDGDPTTGDARLAEARNETIYAVFDRWAEALKRKGVRRIEGDLVIGTGVFEKPFVHPDWPASQHRRWYSAPVAGVNFNDNCLDVGFDVRNGRVRPVISPVSRFLRTDSRVRTGKRHLWSCRFDKTGTRVTLSGTVTRSTSQPFPVAVPNPPALFACVLAERLAMAGIAVKGDIVISTGRPAAGAGQEHPRWIATERTPLASALSRANKQSLNMMAECLFLRSAVGDGEPATWPRAAEAAGKTLIRDYGLKAGTFTVSDGSGLSRANRISPSGITALLAALVDNEQFVRSLPVAGVDGSLRNRFRSDGLRGRILAKTGSLNGVSALSGYVLDRKGVARMAFSILVNGTARAKGRSARTLQQNICQRLIRSVDDLKTAGTLTN